MLIDCPACARSYHVSPAEIEGGRTVICPRCDARWFVESMAAAAFAPPLLAAPEPPIGGVAFATVPPRASRLRRRFRMPRGVTLGLASLALVSLTIGARAKIVQMLPRTAALYAVAGMPVNLRGLDFKDVRTVRLDPASPEVRVSGEIRNVAHGRVRVPRLAFEIRDGAGQPLIRWSERAPVRLVATGRAFAFTSTPHQIPPESRSVLVHFESDGASG